MSALLLALVVSAGPCFELVEPTAGWKRVELAGASKLAVLDDVPQFRSGERVLFVTRQTDLYDSGVGTGGSTEFELPLPADAQAMTLTFGDPLRGAKVDVTGWNMTLLHEQRVPGPQVSVSWGRNDVDRLWVRVHQHLRKPPVLMEVQVERLVLPAELGLPPAFAQSNSLYFFQSEPAQRLVLCENSGRTLRVTQEAVQARRELVTVRRSAGRK